MSSVGLLVDELPLVEGEHEDIVRDLLVGMGHTVALYDPSADPATVAGAHAFLVHAPMGSTAETTIGTGYLGLAVPIVVLANRKQTFQENYGLAGNGLSGTNRTWYIYAAAEGDPLAAGYTGSETVWSGSSSSMTNYFTSNPAPGGLLVANRNGNLTDTVMFDVPAGAALWNTGTSAFDGNTTHGWRGALCAPAVNVISYRTAVWENLFRALVDKAEANSTAPPPSNESPTAAYTITPSQSVAVGTEVTATLNGTDTDGTIASYSHSLSVPAGSATTLSSTTAQAPTFTPDIAGAYAVTGTVTDDDGATSAAVSKTINAGTVVPPAGEPEVSLTATIDLRGIVGSGGTMSYAVAFESGDNADPLTETVTGLFTRPAPVTTTVYTWTATEAGGTSVSGTATIVIAESESLEDVFVKVADEDPRWLLVNRPGDRLFNQDGTEVVA